MDLVTHVPYLPKAGETITSSSFHINPGGKGANQAVAAAKLGADVTMIGKVGHDEYGQALLHSLRQAGVNTEGIQKARTTGMAFIQVSSQGENHIVLVPGANSHMRKSDIDQMKHLIQTSDLIIMQFEIPIDVVEYVLYLAYQLNKEVILNPAPAQRLSKQMLSKVDTLILNETELEILGETSTNTQAEILNAAQKLKSFGVKRIIVTVGAQGSYLLNQDGEYHIPAVSVEAIDTTAAGDAYIAAFAVGLSKGLSDQEAAKFASKVSAIVVTRKGAQSSLPTIEEIQ
ncbi:ribokinase [Thermoflavimicrobium daqui]|uniref:Deoxyribokinase n=2 Tax=Thermoflavimicrobium daqui TaxID=2137476 RepID=A0A364K4I9_9BACL|nr:ribokinase [Thermoflavimicrobium daqui]